MEDLNEFERAVLDMLLAGDHPFLAALRRQTDASHLASRKYTGAGFICRFEVPDDAPRVTPPNYVFGDVGAEIEGLLHGAGFLIFVRDGKMKMLEGFSYQEPWPKVIGPFVLNYVFVHGDSDKEDAVELTTEFGVRRLRLPNSPR